MMFHPKHVFYLLKNEFKKHRVAHQSYYYYYYYYYYRLLVTKEKQTALREQRILNDTNSVKSHLSIKTSVFFLLRGVKKSVTQKKDTIQGIVYYPVIKI